MTKPKNGNIDGNGYQRDKERCQCCLTTHRVVDGLCRRCWQDEPEVRIVTVRVEVTNAQR